MKISKVILTFITLAIVASYAGIISAHTLPGALGRLKSKAAATDIYRVTCSNAGDGTGDPDHLLLHVKDLPTRNPARISIQAQYTDPVTGAVSVTPISTDRVDSDRYFSPEVSLTGGVGPYLMFITKSRSSLKGREIYLAEFHCQSSPATGSQHTGTDWQMIQNQ